MNSPPPPSVYRIVILNSIHRDYEEEKKIFAPLPHELIIESSLHKEKIIETCRFASAVCANLAPFSREVIASLERCRVISVYGIGYDHIDLEAALEKNIEVCHCPSYCVEEASDHALGLLLCVIRGIASSHEHLRQGGWGSYLSKPVISLKDKTIGIIGCGETGEKMIKKLRGFSPRKILVHDPSKSEDQIACLGAKKSPFENILKESHVISIHTPLNEQTHHLFGYDQLKAMRRDAYLINTARGKIIKEEDLIRALEQGLIAGAGIDVYEREPLDPKSRLRSLNNVVLTEHSAWYSLESLSRLKTVTASNVYRVLTGKAPLYPVPLS